MDTLTISGAVTEVFTAVTSAAALFTSGVLVYVPALALGGWGLKKLFGAFRRR